MNLNELTRQLTPDIYQRLRTAVEIGKWPDGRRLSTEQVEICMQAIIAYEHQHIPETEHTGYIPPKETPCTDHDHADSDQPVKWQ